ncbi:hypothetical protein STENM36S_02118 [Streptomyces tendae]
MDAVPAACGVSGRYGSPQVSVLNGERDQAAGAAGDVPGQAPAEPFGADPAVRIRRDELVGQPAGGCLPVGPGDEVLYPDAQAVHGERACAGAGAAQVVGVVVEQQLPLGHHALQDPDGVHDGGDGHPGDIADLAFGAVVAVLVAGGLVHGTRDQVPPCVPRAVRLRVGAAAAAQSGHLAGAHPGQIGDDDEARRAQLAHQEACFGVVDGLSPGCAAEFAGDRDTQRAGAGPLQGGPPPAVIAGGVADLREGGAGERGDIGARDRGSAQPPGGRNRQLAGVTAVHEGPKRSA